MEKTLRLSLVTKWFEITKSGIKTEDYRLITAYWLKRLFDGFDETDTPDMIEEVIYQLNTFDTSLQELNLWAGLKPKRFDCNIMTLGYPKSTDTERILKLEHKGIEIRKGNPEWGAEPGKIYFVIMHGDILLND